jgi:hypothetical protein
LILNDLCGPPEAPLSFILNCSRNHFWNWGRKYEVGNGLYLSHEIGWGWGWGIFSDRKRGRDMEIPELGRVV